MELKNWQDYTYHPPLLDNYKLGFKYGQKYSNGFGNLTGRPHLGQDYLLPIGKPIYAIADGITKTFTGIQAGNMVTLTTNRGLSVRYMHLDKFVQESNGRVSRGQIIGYTGNTGKSTAPHLHLDIFKGVPTNINQFSNFIDPLSLNYAINMLEKPQEFNFQGKEFQTRIFENYEILLAYPVLFIAHKYGYKDGEFAWNDKGGFRNFIRWWGQYRSKEQFKQAVEADFQTWLKEQGK
jgi:murein DD-endopeptidase MepM/ murein hydrolase activator NlpD